VWLELSRLAVQTPEIDVTVQRNSELEVTTCFVISCPDNNNRILACTF